MLQKYTSEGQFFFFTNGGAVKTSPDMVVMHAQKRSIETIAQLEKERDAKLNYHLKTIPKAKKVFKKKLYSNCNGIDTKWAIKYKQRPVLKEKVKITQNVAALKDY